MHSIAVILVGLLLVAIVYQLIQLNFLINKESIEDEVYERLTTSIFTKLAELVTIVVVYFFGKENGKMEANEITRKT